MRKCLAVESLNVRLINNLAVPGRIQSRCLVWERQQSKDFEASQL
jgi:hypothetical protein